MKAMQQYSPFHGPKLGVCDGRATKQQNPCSEIRGFKKMDEVKNSCLASNREKSFSLPVIGCQRRKFPMVNCQSNERLGQVNGHPAGKAKEETFDSILHPGSVGRELTSLVIPAVMAQALDPFAQLVETAYIGRLGPLELASSGVSVSVFNIISKLFNIPLLSITTSFVSEDISKNASKQFESDKGFKVESSEHKQVSSKTTVKLELPSVSTALLLSVIIGSTEALALFFGAGFFLNMMGISPASPMRSPSQQFLCLRAFGAPAVVVSLAVQGVFRGFKDMKTPLFCVGVGNVSTVVLLPLLAYAFNMGITGAAIATVASQYITAVLLIWSLSKSADIFPPKLKDLQLGGYIKYGGLLLGRTLAVLITMTIGTSMAARLGPLPMAGHQICLQVWMAVSLLSDALAVSAQALIASSFAKSEYKRVKEVTYTVLKTGMFAGISLAVVLGVSFGNIAELFTKDVQVLQIVKSGLLFVSASQPINALAFIFDGLHYGVSDFSYAAFAMMISGAISSVVLLSAPPFFGLPGVWFGLTLFMVLRTVAGFLRLNWKTGPWWFLQLDAQIFESQLLESSDSSLPVEADQMQRDYTHSTE
ncbi:protein DETOXIFICATION 45, chloroplastic isoform X2 [Asparagus officinalis]|uniref:protein DETOXIFICATION 45, chloroplastic isoform X2 n=1 Tax=Asparagus officinalis TaxID=4686 RepID=UPI00098E49FF|nr:protein DETOXIFICATION 45, chloroplastic isoform X2 [Asparagus officinalis]